MSLGCLVVTVHAFSNSVVKAQQTVVSPFSSPGLILYQKAGKEELASQLTVPFAGHESGYACLQEGVRNAYSLQSSLRSFLEAV